MLALPGAAQWVLLFSASRRYALETDKYGPVAQLVRASSLYLDGRWFESNQAYQPSRQQLAVGGATAVLRSFSVEGHGELAMAGKPRIYDVRFFSLVLYRGIFCL